MKVIHILNPAAGDGAAMKYRGLENVYITTGTGDARRYVESQLKTADDEICFVVYGGDGSANEVVDGIITSGSDRAYLSVVPTGTGNDLVRTVALSKSEIINADVLTLNERYSINAINAGFDLKVVMKANEYKRKPLISGSLAYILGVISVLTGKLGMRMRISYTDSEGRENQYDGDCLLVVAANGLYYGGGFMASPAADITDGLIDLMIIKNMSRRRFISLVGKYKHGLHIDRTTGKVTKGFEDVITFSKCRSVVIEGISEICADGEIFEAKRADIGILRGAVRIVRTV